MWLLKFLVILYVICGIFSLLVGAWMYRNYPEFIGMQNGFWRRFLIVVAVASPIIAPVLFGILMVHWFYVLRRKIPHWYYKAVRLVRRLRRR